MPENIIGNARLFQAARYKAFGWHKGTGVQKKQSVFNLIGKFVPKDKFIPDKKIPQDDLNPAENASLSTAC